MSDSTPEKYDPTFVPAVILRNKGVPIRIKRATEAGEIVIDDEGNALTKEVFLRFDANAVSDIEEFFDGFVATVHVTSPSVMVDPATGAALRDKDGVPIIQEQIVSARTETFYGMEAFQKAMEVKQNKTTRDAIAIALGMEPRACGNVLLDGEMATYASQVGIAWSLANGLDPTSASGALRRALGAVEKQRLAVGDALEREILAQEDDTPGTPGSEPGPAPIEASRTSGD